MTDVSTTTTQEAPKAPRVKSVIEDMAPKSPSFFSSVDEAVAYLTRMQTELPDFGNYPLIANGIDGATGDFDPAVYTDETRVMVHVLTNRGTKSKDAQGNEVTNPSTVRAIVIHPVPTYDAIMNDEAGLKWLHKIVNTQLSHVAVAPLRKADNLEVAQKDMPGLAEIDGANVFNLASFFSGRESSSVTETYDKLFRGIIDGFNPKSTPWKRARLNKAELKKALESTAYALAVYPTLEDRGDKPSLFVMAAQVGIREAKAQGLDPTIFETWLATRDDKSAAEAGADEEEDFDLDDIVIGAEAEAAPVVEEAAPAAEANEMQPAE